MGAEKTVRKESLGQRENNFAIIRYAATMFVFAGHMGMIMGVQPPLFAGIRLHEIGVSMLFLISGYLITKSWLSDPNPLRYGIRRFFRLWPPFAVMILLMVFIAGPLVSQLSWQEYFQGGWQVYLRNLRFYIIYALPGVFTELPVASAVNGSLWTMPVEAGLYVITPLLLTAMRVRKNQKVSFVPMAVLTVAAFVFDLYLRVCRADAWVVFYATDIISAYHLTVMYLIGMLFTYEQMRKILNVQAGCAAMCLLFLFQTGSVKVVYTLLYLIFPYFIFSIVFAPKPVFSKVGRKMELSYGIYLYGFFFQQLAVQWQQQRGVSLGYTKTLFLSLIPTLIAAVFSYYLVERPAIRFGRMLVEKLKSRG